MRTVLPILLVFGLAIVANAEIYKWTDARGQVHFTQHLDQVPPDQRPAAKSAAQAPKRDVIQTFSSPASAASGVARPASSIRRTGASNELRIPFQRYGTLMRVDVRINDLVTAPFFIDTGASGVSLPSHVADQLGIRVRPDTPHIQVITAAGTVSRAVVTLRSVQLSSARVENLEATINPAMEIGLLGGTFFNNFVYRVDAAEGVITLSPNESIRGGLNANGWRHRFEALRAPLQQLEAHLVSGRVRRQHEREYLEERAIDMRSQLDALEDEANRLNVPQTWRR